MREQKIWEMSVKNKKKDLKKQKKSPEYGKEETGGIDQPLAEQEKSLEDSAENEKKSQITENYPEKWRGYTRDDEKKLTETEKSPDVKETEDQEKTIYPSEEDNEELDEREKYPETVREENDEQKKISDENGEYPEKMRKDAEELYERENYPETVAEDRGEQEKKDKPQKHISRLAILILILTGLFEDFPVVIVMFYTAVTRICGAPARQEVGSGLTMATIISSMLNSLWTMIILFCELCGCQKLFQNISSCCCQRKSASPKHKFKNLCRMSCFSKPSKNCCKNTLKTFGKVLLFGFILLLFTCNFSVGLLTIAHITGTIPLEPVGVKIPFILNHFVVADGVGPGLDVKRDEAMFILIEMKIPQPYQVILFDNEFVITARSSSTNQIMNRVYIGQLQELSHLKEGTLTKAVPCSRMFSFVDKVDETLFTWNGSMPSRSTDFSDCKLIFTFRYFPTNNDWNPFKELFHTWFSDIRIEWGIHINDNNICPSGVRQRGIKEVLTKEVENDIITYTCSSACGKDTNICTNAHHTRLRPFYGSNFGQVFIPSHLYFTINDMEVPDTCSFISTFEYSSKFCDISWADMETIEVPTEIQYGYPQFITIPELHKRDEEQSATVPRYFCDQLWNNSQACCVWRN